MLVHGVETSKDNQGHDSCRSKLKKVCIGNKSEKNPDLHLHHGVIKMQNNNVAGVTTMEHDACSSLLTSCTDENNADSTEMMHEERKEDFKKRKLGNKYDFVVHYVFLL